MNTDSSSPQNDDPLLACLLAVAEHYHIDCSAAAVTSGLPLVENRLTPKLLPRAALSVGIQSAVKKKAIHTVHSVNLPAIAILKSNQAAVIYDIDHTKNEVKVAGAGRQSEWIEISLFNEAYSGYIIFMKPIEQFDRSVSAIADSTVKEKHWFWSVIFSSKRIYRDVLIAALFVNLFALANPLFVMNVYDRVVPNNAIETLWVLAIGVIIAYFFDFLLRLLRGYFIEVAGKKSDILLSAYLFEKVLGARFSMRPASTGAFISQLREFDTVRQFFTASAITTIIDLPFLLIFLGFIYYIGGAIVAVPLFALPILLAVTLVMQRPIKKAVDNTFLSSAQKNATLVETMVGLETVKVLGAEGYLQYRWEQAVGHLAKWSQRTRLLSLGVTSVAGLIQQVSSVVLVIVGVYLIADRELTMGALIACVILSGRALAPISQMASLLVNYDQTKTALASLNDIATKEQERDPKKPYIARKHFQGAIRFDKVSFHYPEDQHKALEGVSFSIAPGEKVGIIGRIGSGKTTIQKLIMGLHRPTEGTILVDNIDIQQIDPADLRSSINYVPQQVVLFAGSVKSNITYGQIGIDDERVVNASDLAGVSRFVNAHPQGFERQVGERGESLSGGQQQSIAIARAVLSPGAIMLLDEPTNGMDNSSESAVLSNLKNHIADQSLIVVTHKTSLLSLVDRVIVLDQGRLVADGAKDSVLDALRKGQLSVG